MPVLTGLFDLLLAHQRRLERLTADTPPLLTLVEGHILTEIAERPSTTFSVLAKSLNLPKSKLSRLLNEIESRGWIKRTSDSKDKRAALIEISQAGQELYDRNECLLAEIMDRALENLNPKQAKELCSYFDVLAEALGSPQVKKAAHPFLRVLRRLTRATGMLESRFLDSSLTAQHFQILYLLEQSPELPRAIEIRQELRLPASSISRLVSELADNKLLNSQPDSADQRATRLNLSPKGKSVVSKVRRLGERLLKRLLKAQSKKFINDFRGLLEIYLGEKLPEFSIGSLSVQSLVTEASRREGRAFVVEYLARTGRALEIPEQLMPKTSKNYLLRQNQAIIGVVSLAENKPAGGEDYFLHDTGVLSRAHAEKVLTAIKKHSA